jgi:uncharacterized delta-60 repeat protein
MKRSVRTMLWCALLASAGAFAQAQDPWSAPLPAYFPHFRVLGNATSLQPDGKRLFAGIDVESGISRDFVVVRTEADGTPDRAFGNDGRARVAFWGSVEYAHAVAVLADGGIVVGGHASDPAGIPACDYWAFCNAFIGVIRLDADGRLDASFNGSGRLALHVGRPPRGVEETFALTALEPLADGSFIVRSAYPHAVALVTPQGTLDAAFAAAQAVKMSSFEYHVAAAFHNAALDQYFVTADADEISKLDGSASHGWRSMADGFHVYRAGTADPNTVPVCRFNGLRTTGLASHVLTANAEECIALASAPRNGWILETWEVFRVTLPDALTGMCASDGVPVFRLWNARPDSGHHLTTDREIRDALLAKGYVSEGWGPLGVAMCAAP